MRQEKEKKCTLGVYIAKGSKGIRIGQSACPETRVTRVAKELEKRIGKVERVVIIPVVDRKQRLKLEKSTRLENVLGY